MYNFLRTTKFLLLESQTPWNEGKQINYFCYVGRVSNFYLEHFRHCSYIPDRTETHYSRCNKQTYRYRHYIFDWRIRPKFNTTRTCTSTYANFSNNETSCINARIFHSQFEPSAPESCWTYTARRVFKQICKSQLPFGEDFRPKIRSFAY